jgi:molecular chaperone DnaJ
MVLRKSKSKTQSSSARSIIQTCSTCNGQGQVMRLNHFGRMQSASTCPTCGGSGQILDKKPSEADSQGMIGGRNSVYKNTHSVVDGMQLKVSNKGTMLQETVFQEI